MTAALGEEDRLLELLCQPALVRGQLPLGDGVELWGIDSGLKHHVAGAEYGTVRAATLMGKRLLTERLGAIVPAHLADMGQKLVERHLDVLPTRLRGAEFLERFGDIDDPVSRVDPERDYSIRAATLHPIVEQERATRFADLLRASGEPDLEACGGLMAESHASYAACGLGSAATDRLVELVRRVGPEAGLFGAKITGGGNGGTVAVLARRGAADGVRSVAEAYAKDAGCLPRLFRGSSPGAVGFGAVAAALDGGTVRSLEVFY
jgi:L-arabinokinase